MDKGFNDAAYRRAIVMHGADYVSDSFAAMHKRIGRSWGCPAVPRELSQSMINTIKGRNFSSSIILIRITFPLRNG
jgi:hypothetical protein